MSILILLGLLCYVAPYLFPEHVDGETLRGETLDLLVENGLLPSSRNSEVVRYTWPLAIYVFFSFEFICIASWS